MHKAKKRKVPTQTPVGQLRISSFFTKERKGASAHEGNVAHEHSAGGITAGLAFTHPDAVTCASGQPCNSQTGSEAGTLGCCQSQPAQHGQQQAELVDHGAQQRAHHNEHAGTQHMSAGTGQPGEEHSNGHGGAGGACEGQHSIWVSGDGRQQGSRPTRCSEQHMQHHPQKSMQEQQHSSVLQALQEQQQPSCVLLHPSPKPRHSAGMTARSSSPSIVAGSRTRQALQSWTGPSLRPSCILHQGRLIAPPPCQQVQQFMVLDIEATCDAVKTFAPQEIIELSAVMLDATTLEITDEIQLYVRPTVHPLLTDFCLELTGISQQCVDAGLPLASALDSLNQWIEQSSSPLAASEGEGPPVNSGDGCQVRAPVGEQGRFFEGIVGPAAGNATDRVGNRSWLPVTWTDWDLQVQLFMECNWRQIERPAWAQRWVNLRHVSTKLLGSHSLSKAVSVAGLQWRGRQHCGLDDARNTAYLAAELIRRGARLCVTTSFQQPSEPDTKQSKLHKFFGRSDDGAPSKTIQGAVATEGRPGVVLPPSVLPQPPAAMQWMIWDRKCWCGSVAALRVTKKPGPNHKRQFYSCGKYSVLRGAQCQFMVWKDELKHVEGAPWLLSRKR